MGQRDAAKITIIVAAHKQYQMPSDPMYLPVHVGSQGKEPLGFQPDNEGDNISEKNPCYCELTGLYWAWKNLDCDYLGLAHYRRHFTKKGLLYRTSHAPMDSVLKRTELEPLLREAPIIVPQKRRYYIESLYSHYAHTHYQEHIDITRQIIAEKCPQSLPAYDKILKRRTGHMFNMFIMKKSLADAYCEWLFDILEELDKRLAGREYSAFQARYCGRVSELLFNVWLAEQSEPVKVIGYLPIEKEKWLKKGKAFLQAKFGKKYEASF